jgi:hypothetical protein
MIMPGGRSVEFREILERKAGATTEQVLNGLDPDSPPPQPNRPIPRARNTVRMKYRRIIRSSLAEDRILLSAGHILHPLIFPIPQP